MRIFKNVFQIKRFQTMITTILQIYKRPQYLAEQLEAIRKQTTKSDKLIIVHNYGGIPLSDFDIPEDATVIAANDNLKYHLRFAIGLLAETEYVSFFDDDTIPGENWYKNCVETIDKHNCICVTNGRIVNRVKRQQYGPGWSNPSDTEVLVDFGGHAWFMRTETLKFMWFGNILEYRNGEDIQLSANAQIFGNIPTFVPPHPRADMSVWGSGKNAMKYGSDEVSSWIVNASTHNDERYRLFDKYVEKGWKLILENQT